jgi:hypothetical protein
MKTTSILICIVAASIITYTLHSIRIVETRVSAYADGYKAGLAEAPKPDIDRQCVAWLFSTNLKQARKRVCTKGI